MKTAADLNINERQRYNLIKMGLWLHNNKERLKPSFSMETFAYGANSSQRQASDMFTPSGEYLTPNECGTSCCIIGHSVNPNIGLKCDAENPLSKLRNRPWTDIGGHLFGYDADSDPARTGEQAMLEEDTWNFLFGGSHIPDVGAAASRIFWLLEKGIDAEFREHFDVDSVEVRAVDPEAQVLDALYVAKDDIIDETWELDIPKWEEELKNAEAALSKTCEHENT
jgi:hypothetical protein